VLLRNLWQACLGRETLGDFVMPGHHGLGAFPMHLFGRREIVRVLKNTGFKVIEVRAISIAGALHWPWLGAGWRSYGYLLAVRRRAGGVIPRLRHESRRWVHPSGG
jgi:hypothetical protein